MPIMMLSLVRSASGDWRPLAIPKSVSSTRPSDVIMMLPGLTSRCTKPASCAWSSAERDARADVTREFGAEALLRVEQLSQALALDELHHHRLPPVLGEHVVDRDDVRVVQAGGGDRLATEPFGDDLVGREVRLEPLHRHLAIERQIDGQPDLGHATLGELPLQLVSLGDARWVSMRRPLWT